MTDAVDDVIAKFVSNLKEAMGPASVAEVAHRAGMAPETLTAILVGIRQPRFADVVALESAVEADLWPGPIS